MAPKRREAREPLAEGKVPRGDFHCYRKKSSGAELRRKAAGNWLEHSECEGLRNVNRAQATSPAVA